METQDKTTPDVPTIVGAKVRLYERACAQIDFNAALVKGQIIKLHAPRTFYRVILGGIPRTGDKIGVARSVFLRVMNVNWMPSPDGTAIECELDDLTNADEAVIADMKDLGWVEVNE